MNAEQFSYWLAQKRQPSAQEISKKTLIMGVVNVTADSFSDGGAYLSVDNACDRAFTLMEHGADIIDIGGESSRPGALSIDTDVELARVIPVIEQIRAHSDVCISIDSYKPEVLSAAVRAGASMINDIYALRSKHALEVAAHLAVPVCLMHMQGTPKTMQENPQYPLGIITEIVAFFQERINVCLAAGIDRSRLILDPGFGFGKQVQHNLQLMNQLEELKQFNCPILLGVSRKSTIGAVLNKPTDQRLIGGVALAVYAALKDVGILRTHDVDETNQALQIINAVRSAS